MKSFDRMFFMVICIMTIFILCTNIFLHRIKSGGEGRPYRVEVGRIAAQIGQEGLESVDLSGWEYVKNVEAYNGEGFFDTDSDYIVREIDGSLYRFDYSGADKNSKDFFFAVNGVFAAAAAAIIFLLLYIRIKIIMPFERMKELPAELSKGNLTVPLKAEKNRFFGGFLWGMDLLRETIESQKERELALQREKKTLLLSLSHDIKTPLSAIKLYAKALSRGLYTDRQKQMEIAGSIDERADEIEGYVSRIITASREDFLSLEVTMGEFYLSELVGGITGYYFEKLSLLKTEFLVGKYEDCLLAGDLDRSVEVLQNIMENAVKYGDGVWIELSFGEEDDYLLISVRNSGCTLKNEELSHIFDSFWRGSNVGNTNGSGLGLHICRQLMHKMKGEIFAEEEREIMSVTAVFGKA